jgi:hypothetical protein
MTAALIALKAASCFVVQSRKAHSISFEVSGVRIDVCSASFSRYTAIYHMSPRKDQTSDAIFGVGQDKILSMHDDMASIPRCNIWWPRKSTSVQKNFDFLALRQRPCSRRHFIISRVFLYGLGPDDDIVHIYVTNLSDMVSEGICHAPLMDCG